MSLNNVRNVILQCIEIQKQKQWFFKFTLFTVFDDQFLCKSILQDSFNLIILIHRFSNLPVTGNQLSKKN